MTLSRLQLKPLDNMDLNKARKNLRSLKKSKMEFKKTRSWKKTQGVVTLVDEERAVRKTADGKERRNRWPDA